MAMIIKTCVVTAALLVAGCATIQVSQDSELEKMHGLAAEEEFEIENLLHIENTTMGVHADAGAVRYFRNEKENGDAQGDEVFGKEDVPLNLEVPLPSDTMGLEFLVRISNDRHYPYQATVEWDIEYQGVPGTYHITAPLPSGVRELMIDCIPEYFLPDDVGATVSMRVLLKSNGITLLYIGDLMFFKPPPAEASPPARER